MTSCDDDIQDNTATDLIKSEIKTNYANLLYANYTDALTDAKALQTSLVTFTAEPTEANFEASKMAWLTSRESYGQTEAFRFSDGPIDDEDGPEGALNAWPLDEVYIDYVDGDETSGIINNLDGFPSITADVLEGLNESGGEKNISIGYHAIEFLLWGQDLTAPDAELAGQRPYTDFVTGDNGTASNQSRRAAYINACADLIIIHLQSMVDAWDGSATSNYRADFMLLDDDQAVTNILTGIGILSKAELAGERIQVALELKDQEDEHSCFSDNTHRDIVQNAQGIFNVYQGTYTSTLGNSVTGSSIDALITVVDPALAAEIKAQIVVAKAAVEAINDPFDLAISSEEYRPAVAAAVTALRTLGDQFAAVGTALGYNVTTELPE